MVKKAPRLFRVAASGQARSQEMRATVTVVGGKPCESRPQGPMGDVVVATEPSGTTAIRRAGALRSVGDLKEVTWIKASASESGGCVELASVGSTIYIQDSKTPDGGPVLAVSIDALAGLFAAIRRS
ncbi:DUF397 domain-containing protein [Spirillospora sp. NPDC048911]|uniref:DUF397 domain-containing protein n=1 Tax=Spirillospora sp. NPDC048911 TaxID=3364527 RepID=UPI00372007AE